MPPTTGYSAALDTNDLIMSIIPEVTWGVTPDTPAFKTIRLDGEGFSGSKTRLRPNEIEPSGQAVAAITVKEESTGTLNFSVSASLTTNLLIASSLNGAFTDALSYSGSDVAITVADGTTCTLTATGAFFTAADIVVLGQFIKVFAAGSAAGSFIGRVVAVTSNTELDLDCCSESMITVIEGTMGATTIKGSMLRNGTTFNSFTVEKKMSATLYLRYAGAFPTEGSLEVGVGDYLKGTMSFLNKAEVAATSMITDATYDAATVGTVIDSVRGIGTVWRGVDVGTTPGVVSAIAGIVQKLSVKWTKEGAAAQYGIGSAAAVGVRSGRILVTGAITTFFANLDLYDQYIDEQAGPISFYAIDGDPNAAATRGYVITFCNANIMNPKVVAGSASADFMAEFEIEGAPDVSSTSLFGGKTLQIDYFA